MQSDEFCEFSFCFIYSRFVAKKATWKLQAQQKQTKIRAPEEGQPSKTEKLSDNNCSSLEKLPKKENYSPTHTHTNKGQLEGLNFHPGKVVTRAQTHPHDW